MKSIKKYLILLFLGALQTQAQINWSFTDSKYSYQLQLDSAKSHENAYYDCILKQLTITRLTDKKIVQQLKADLPSDCRQSKEQAFILEDVNFDGSTDLRLLRGNSTFRNTYYYWLFDSKTGQFSRDTTLQEIRNPVFNKETKTISSTSSDGCSQGFTTVNNTFEYQNGKLVLIEQTESSVHTPKNIHSFVKKKLVDGQLKIIERTTTGE